CTEDVRRRADQKVLIDFRKELPQQKIPATWPGFFISILQKIKHRDRADNASHPCPSRCGGACREFPYLPCRTRHRRDTPPSPPGLSRKSARSRSPCVRDTCPAPLPHFCRRQFQRAR